MSNPSLVSRLKEGCIEHRRRWSGDTHSDIGGSIDAGKTDALMREAAAEIERLELALDPRRWDQAASDAWHRNIPDVMAAFSALREAARVPGAQGFLGDR